MRRGLIPVLLALGGCSTAPVADFLDATAPGGVARPQREEPPRIPAPPAPILPIPAPRRGEDPPPLPPVPAGNSPATRNADDSPARLQPPPGADGAQK